MEGIANVLENHLDALNFRAKRQNVIASNIANADTPGYKAVDLSFPQRMQQAKEGQLEMAATHAGHVSTAQSNAAGAVLYRRPSQQSIDSNTVDTQQEMALFTDNSLKMEAALKAVSHEFKQMRIALDN
jgi:flagellar basal-body rod protein FlgB